MKDLADVDPETLRPDPIDVRDDARLILDDVRRRGDDAVREATRRFDDVDIGELTVSASTIESAAKRVPDELLDTLDRLRDRIAAVQRAQRPADPGRIEPTPGVTLDVAYRPLDRVGCYVPGGRAAYPSTALMTAVPARVAGVDEVVIATPPGPNGSPPDATLAACQVADVDRVLPVGGVQAIAALAYGTEQVPRVDKVVGPGNAYVDAAKGLLHGRAGIDMPAGPTELVVVADATADAAHIAADLLAQAEHDPAAQSVLVALDDALAAAVEDLIEDPVGDVHVLVGDDREQVRDWVDAYAPEHLQVAVEDPGDLVDIAAGTVFVGDASAVLGDYATGADHVLPTGGAARWVDGLGVDDFLVRRVVQRVDANGFEALVDDARRLADVEGLDAHAAALEVRR